MNRLIVNGGRRLNGTALINGAKNSVLPLLAATLINSGINVLHNCPQLADVDSAVRILRHLGCKVERENVTITVDSSVLTGCEFPD
ncbi:MAG: UDP-N-acetylglucosamine 1-carboxyvinyltransferase, partial [Angelakisella sp.]